MSTSIPSLITSSSVKKEQRISFLQYMLMAREFDLAMQRLNRQGRAFGGVYSQTGNEATSVGSASALGPNDVLFPMHRNIGDRKSTRLNSSHEWISRMPSSA